MLTTKTVQSVYGLRHHVSIVEKVIKHIWISWSLDEGNGFFGGLTQPKPAWPVPKTC
jgi:hypothetical protein